MRQKISPPEVAIIGSYHGGNTGDMALAGAIQLALKDTSTKYGLQSHYNLGVWPKAPRAIIGGGAIADESFLRNLAERYRGQWKRVAILGVGFVGDIQKPDILQFLREISVFSVRTHDAKQKFESMTGQTIANCAYDLSFAHFEENAYRNTSNNHELPIGINLAEVQCSLLNKSVQIESEFVEASSDAHRRQGERIFQQYRTYFRAIVAHWLAQGKKVTHIPFTVGDDTIARHILEGMDVTYLKFQNKPAKVLARIRNVQRFYTTRFHALAFGIMCGVPVTPYCYAAKCRNLLLNLDIKNEIFLSPERFIDNPIEPLITKAICENGLIVPAKQLTQIKTSVHNLISSAYNRIQDA
ncbi:polysaccharide pyruvyl transferase family protein [Cerasicoccus arenae]|uniref:polysaccharide pyruvyl transferase family protein n=1 Tax=Cerasicoccus arenae TaxID=424488 RepID=UPI00167531BC|nr:polysaccharide pyruvyl transferase family protein [Cerasicoccus arenae]MBK1859837.1 polysaccharide pyruvyl transferase family protein [Cerasicoccus arenae]